MRNAVPALLAFALAPLGVWGDTVAMEDGAVWQNVRIASFRLTDGKPEFQIEPTASSLPSELKAGWYSGVRRADFAAVATPASSQSRQTASLYPPIEATVISVVQADLLRLDSGQKVRLVGVDTPETTDPDRPLEFFGRESFLYTKKKAEGQRVRIEFDQQRMDDFGQLLGYVHLADGTFLNLDIVRTGHGHAWLGAAMSEENSGRFRDAETSARREQLGLWNAGKREATGRSWQVAEPIAATVSLAPRSSASRSSSSDYTRPSRGAGRRSITVDVQYYERPVFGWGPGGLPMPGKAIELTVQPH
jgi:endonuclease YncB( thermonuclease family)